MRRKIFDKLWPRWWPSGQLACRLLWCSKFECRCSLQFFCKNDAWTRKQITARLPWTSVIFIVTISRKISSFGLLLVLEAHKLTPSSWNEKWFPTCFQMARPEWRNDIIIFQLSPNGQVSSTSILFISAFSHWSEFTKYYYDTI